VRGLGTAILHGTTTAALAMVAIHSAFNHVLLPPRAMTAVLLLVLPAVILIVFHLSERATCEWLGAGLGLDVERRDLEISVQAKAMLLAREAGLEIPLSEDLHASLREVAYLQTSIGRTGLLALKPLQFASDRDQWHRYLLAAAPSSK
jgi:hypothetical protein